MKFRFLFAWYDFWIGAYWDKENRRLYILPLPMLGVVIDFRRREVRDAFGCGCCGRVVTQGDGAWCLDCQAHILPDETVRPWLRTYECQFNRRCPYDDA